MGGREGAVLQVGAIRFHDESARDGSFSPPCTSRAPANNLCGSAILGFGVMFLSLVLGQALKERENQVKVRLGPELRRQEAHGGGRAAVL